MPFEHAVTPWEASLFKLAEERKQVIGCDGLFSLPIEQRVLLEVAHAAKQLVVLQAIELLKLTGPEAFRLSIDLMGEQPQRTVEEVDQLLQQLRPF